jgi:serine/threonine-protein kinase
MGAVYLVDDEKLPGKLWAMKQVFPSAVGGRIADALREARVMMGLSHPQLPNIVDLIEGTEADSIFMVMDYIRGVSLEALFQENGRKLDAAAIVRYAIQMGQVFAYLHSRHPTPIIYRDLKPDNVLIDERNQVRLIDFGIARPYRAGQRSDTVQIGTIGFAAPEQFESAQSDRRTDLFALGALMYYLLSGGKYYYAIRRPLSELMGDLPRPLTDLVERLLRTDPDERYQSAEEVVEALSFVLSTTLSINMSTKLPTKLPTIAAPAHQLGLPAEHLASSLASSAPPSSILLLGSLYPGAGATMVGTSLARELHRRKVPHAYVEYPGSPPDLYRLLYGEKRAPRHYRFCDEIVVQADESHRYRRWLDGMTEWVPASPDGLSRPWEAKDSMELMSIVNSPLTLIDVANLWLEQSVQVLARQAAAIIVISDPSPSKMYRPKAARTIATLMEWRNSGVPLYLVANRDLPLKGRKQWLASLFVPPVCCFPELDSERVTYSQWQGRLCADERDIGERIEHSLEPLLNGLLPNLTDKLSKGG